MANPEPAGRNLSAGRIARGRGLPRWGLGILGIAVVAAGVLGLWVGGVIHAPGTVQREAPRARSLMLVTVEGLRADHLHGLGYPRRTTPELFSLVARGASVRWGWIPFPDPEASLEAILRAHPPGDAARKDASPGPPGGALAGRLGSGVPFAAFLEGPVAPRVARRVGLAPASLFEDAPSARAAATHWMRHREGEPFTIWLHLRVPEHRDPRRPSLFAAGRRTREARLVGDYDDRLRELDAEFRALRRSLEGGALGESTLVVVAGVSAPVFDHEMPLRRGEGRGLDPARHRALIGYVRTNAIPEFTDVRESFDALDVLPTALALLGDPLPQDLQGRSRKRAILHGGRLGAERGVEGRGGPGREGPSATREGEGAPAGAGRIIRLWGAREGEGDRPVGIVRGDVLFVRTVEGDLRAYEIVPEGRGAQSLPADIPEELRQSLEEPFAST